MAKKTKTPESDNYLTPMQILEGTNAALAQRVKARASLPNPEQDDFRAFVGKHYTSITIKEESRPLLSRALLMSMNALRADRGNWQDDKEALKMIDEAIATLTAVRDSIQKKG